MGAKTETLGQAKQRHKLELRTLQNEVKAFQKKAKKDRVSKKEVEAQVQQMESDVARRHEEELQAFETEDAGEDGSGDAASADAAVEQPSPSPAAQAETPVETGVPAKVAKAQRRREAKKQQERERRERIEEANKRTVSKRQVEADVIQAQLARQGLAIKDMPSDGHCMYHAVADQMQQHALALPLSVAGTTDATFQELRRLTASYMRSHAADFAPFVVLDDGEDFEDYCGRVEASADWGGQLELRALACALRTPIEVFSADADALLMGAEFLNATQEQTPKLVLTYHLHYYALGEHFNSVQRVDA